MEVSLAERENRPIFSGDDKRAGTGQAESMVPGVGKVSPSGNTLNLPYNMPIKTLFTAHATATGGRNGHAQADDGLVSVDLSVPKAMGGPGKPDTTTPEHLFAAGYAACLGGAIEHQARVLKIPAKSVDVKSAVSIGNSEDGGFGLAVELDVTVHGCLAGGRGKGRSGGPCVLPVFQGDQRQRRGERQDADSGLTGRRPEIGRFHAGCACNPPVKRGKIFVP